MSANQQHQMDPELQNFLMGLTDEERSILLQFQLDARALESAKVRKQLDHQDFMIQLQRKYSLASVVDKVVEPPT